MIPTISEYTKRLDELREFGHARHCTTDGTHISKVRPESLVSIVTVSYNSARSIERTITSVLGQTYSPIEYVVIDGGSTDGTTEIIRKWDSHISYWHSAKDEGISDAFNLGVAAANGVFIAIVNSDDWMSGDQVELLVAALNRSATAFAFGRLGHHATDGSAKYYMDGDADYAKGILWRMPHVNHPTVLARRSTYESIGLFDRRRRVAMDYDWHLRVELAGLRGTYVPAATGHMMEGGVCENDWQRGLREVRDIAIERTGSCLLPNYYYFLRLIRGQTRLFAMRFVPKPLVDFVHRLVNRRYTPVRPKSS
jgi:glycosyltransferase involved in cell wall biosynthesis